MRNRQTIRLRGYNYSLPGIYFVTICTHNREHLFGEITDGEMMINQYGQIINDCWFDLPNHYTHIELDCFVIMPNHIHGILIIPTPNIIHIVGAGFKPALNAVESALNAMESALNVAESAHDVKLKPMRAGLKPIRAGLKPAPTTGNTINVGGTNHALPEIIRALKTFSSRRINKIRKIPGVGVWQRNYYEHIIRNENELNNIRHYIKNNPIKWQDDNYYV